MSGELLGVISTSALELGIDIGGLDVCILVGYPGTVAATWQRGDGSAGRPGISRRPDRSARRAGPVLHAPSPGFLRERVRKRVVDPDNSVVVSKHLVCASAEIPLRTDESIFPVQNYASLLDQLVSRRASKKRVRPGMVLPPPEPSPPGGHPQRRGRIHNFRGRDKRLIGQISVPRVYSECHRERSTSTGLNPTW